MAEAQIKSSNQAWLEIKYKAAVLIRAHFQKIINDIDNPDKQALLNQIDDTLRSLLDAKYLEVFNMHQERLKNLVIEIKKLIPPSEKNQHSFGMLTDQLNILTNYEKRFLKTKTSGWMLFAKGFLMFVDIGILIASTVITFAFPALGIPLFALSCVALGYSTGDFLLETQSLMYRQYNNDLYNNRLTEETKQAVINATQLNDQIISELTIQGLFPSHVEEEPKRSFLPNYLDYIEFSHASAGLLLAIAGLTPLLPPLGIPLVVIIFTTIISALIISVNAYLFNRELASQNQYINTEQAEADAGKEKDSKLLENLISNKQSNAMASILKSPRVESEQTPMSIVSAGRTYQALPVKSNDEDDEESEDEGDKPSP